MRTRAVEDYLKAIWGAEAAMSPVPTSAVARLLGVSAPSATVMLRRLGDMGLVRYARYRGAALTSEGRAAALRLVRSHRVIESFLASVLHLPWDRVHEEAERWEHVVSPDVVERMDEVLGHPRFDVHGHAIPGPDGTITSEEGSDLAVLPPGARGRVIEVSDRDPAVLRELARAGLLPGEAVERVAGAAGSRAVAVVVRGQQREVGLGTARAVKVARGRE